MSRKRQYSDETRAAALAALLEGQAISKVARDYDIPRTTLLYWREKRETGDYGHDKEIGELLVGYMTKTLETLTKQLDKFGDPDWLEKQSASEVAVLHGVMTDKVIRLLEAYGKSEASP